MVFLCTRVYLFILDYALLYETFQHLLLYGMHCYYLLGKGGYVFGSGGLFVCLSVCLYVCGQHYSKSYERIGMKCYGEVLGSTMKNWLNFGGDLGILRWVNEQKNTIIVVAYPDRGAGNDPHIYIYIYFFWSGGGGGVSLSPPSLNIFTVGNMPVMINDLPRPREVCTLWVLLVAIIMYHNVLITPCSWTMPSKVKSSGIKESVSVSWLLVRCSKYVVNYLKIYI